MVILYCQKANYKSLTPPPRFGASGEPALQEQVARATLNLGVTLGQLGHPEEEVATYRDLIARFGAREQPDLRGLATRC